MMVLKKENWLFGVYSRVILPGYRVRDCIPNISTPSLTNQRHFMVHVTNVFFVHGRKEGLNGLNKDIEFFFTSVFL